MARFARGSMVLFSFSQKICTGRKFFVKKKGSAALPEARNPSGLVTA
jgi:hypothetical protein